MVDRREFLGLLTLSMSAIALRVRPRIPEHVPEPSLEEQLGDMIDLNGSTARVVILDKDDRVLAECREVPPASDGAVRADFDVQRAGTMHRIIVTHPGWGIVYDATAEEVFGPPLKNVCLGDTVHVDIRAMA